MNFNVILILLIILGCKSENRNVYDYESITRKYLDEHNVQYTGCTFLSDSINSEWAKTVNTVKSVVWGNKDSSYSHPIINVNDELEDIDFIAVRVTNSVVFDTTFQDDTTYITEDQVTVIECDTIITMTQCLGESKWIFISPQTGLVIKSIGINETI